MTSPAILKNRAALIDMDGFLINSEELYLEANKRYFSSLGFAFTEELHRQGTGRKFPEWIKTVFETEKSGDELFNERNVIFNELAQEKLKLLPGARELLETLHASCKTALVTSGDRASVEKNFALLGIGSYFDLLITGDMVTNGKPDPEGYLLAARMLEISPADCVVFEDAPNGVIAGKRAGMKVVAVPSTFVHADPAFTEADVLCNSLPEINLDQVL